MPDLRRAHGVREVLAPEGRAVLLLLQVLVYRGVEGEDVEENNDLRGGQEEV